MNRVTQWWPDLLACAGTWGLAVWCEVLLLHHHEGRPLILFCALMALVGPPWTMLRLAPRVFRLASDAGRREEMSLAMVPPERLLWTSLRVPFALALLASLPALLLGIQGLVAFWDGRGRWWALLSLGLSACCLQVLPVPWALGTCALQCRRRPTQAGMAASFALFVIVHGALAIGAFLVAVDYGDSKEEIAGVAAAVSLGLIWPSWRLACRAVYDFG